MDDDGALPQGTNTNLHRMVTNLSGQARVGEFISLERAEFIDDFLERIRGRISQEQIYFVRVYSSTAALA
jgi:hypothetical protein